MRAIFDNAYGVTEASKKFFERKVELIGEILSVDSDFDRDEWPTIIKGKDGNLYLSGVTCGYAGEGPHGLLWIMQKLGLHVTIADISATKKHEWYLKGP